MSAASERRVLSFCRLCEAGCGVEVTLDASGAPVAVVPDREHVVTRGFFCTKGEALVELVRDPRRVTHPLRRARGAAPGEFEEVSWDDALADIAARTTAIAQSHGPDAVAVYQGNPAAFSWTTAVSTAALARVIGTGRFYTAGSIDCAERFVIADLCFGNPLLVTIPDLPNTDFALLLGANPAISTWAQLTSIPRWREDVAELRRRRGRFVVVDPRRTETAEAADEHFAIRPGTDLDLLLATANVILDEGREDRAFLGRHASGLGRARAAIAPFTVTRGAQRTGIDAERIVALARSFASARRAFVAGHSGLTMHARGSTAEWAIVLLNAITGRIDARGGLLFNPGIVDFARWSEWLFDRKAPVPSGERPPARRILDDLPCAGLADAIEHEHVRALFVVAGNPAVTFPNAARVRAALARLDLLVSFDPYVNETNQLADYVLPPPAMLEREDCVLLNSPFLLHPYAQWTPAVCDAPAGVRSEWWIVREITRRLGSIPSREPGAGMGRRARLAAARWASRAALAAGPQLVLRAMLSFLAPVSLRTLRRHPHGVRLSELEPGSLMLHVRTRDGRVALDPAPILDLLASDDSRVPRVDPNYPLALVSRRRRGGMNSWLNGLPSSRRVDPEPEVEVNPADAAHAAIAEGDRVRVEGLTGSFEARARVTDRVPVSVVSATHSIAFAAGGGSAMNELVDDAAVDPLSGMPGFQAIPVRIERAARAAPCAASSAMASNP